MQMVIQFLKKKKKNVVSYTQKKETDKRLRFLNKENNKIEIEIIRIENEIKKFNKLLVEVNNGNKNIDIDYNDYNRLNHLLKMLLKRKMLDHLKLLKMQK